MAMLKDISSVFLGVSVLPEVFGLKEGGFSVLPEFGDFYGGSLDLELVKRKPLSKKQVPFPFGGFERRLVGRITSLKLNISLWLALEPKGHCHPVILRQSQSLRWVPPPNHSPKGLNNAKTNKPRVQGKPKSPPPHHHKPLRLLGPQG